MKTLLRALIGSILAASCLCAQGATDIRVDAVFSGFTSNTPGCALGVVLDGKLLYEKGYGLASLELGVPITPQTVFDIGSTSKQITAASIVLLAQRGKLSLDDDVRKFIPELPDYGKKITLRHLLHHTSGLRDYIPLLTLAGAQQESVTTDADALAILAKQRGLNFAPGDDYLYSNSNFFLLSIVVKRASGKPLRQFAQENIFGPLHMADTQILDDHTKVIPRKAASYAPGRDGGFRNVTSNWEQTGDGAVETTVEDLARWDQNFYDPKVGGQALLREIQTTGVLNNGSPISYALGLNVGEYRGLRRVWHGGAWAGFRTDLMRFPDRHFSVIVVCNVANANPTLLAEKVAEVYLERAMKPSTEPTPASTPEGPEHYAGTYWSEKTYSVRRLAARNGKLFMGDGAGAELIPQGGGDFVPKDQSARLHFESGKDGAMRLVTLPRSGWPQTYERVSVPTPHNAEMTPLTGQYSSDEVGFTGRIELRDGKLLLRWPATALALRQEEVELRPITTDVFTAGDLVLRFERGNEGITGFKLASPRARGIQFTRVTPAHVSP
jgi:CubicO group peptidase (beta-lactamase class C family)